MTKETRNEYDNRMADMRADFYAQTAQIKRAEAASYAKVNGLVQRPGIDHDPIKPWQWASVPVRSDPVEIVSYPVPAVGHGDAIDRDSTIMVRMTVGDPCSLVELPLRIVACFAPSRHEWSARPVHRFSDNPSAFVFTDEKPGNACAAILTDVRMAGKS